MIKHSKKLSLKLVALVSLCAAGALGVSAAHAGSATADLSVSASVSANCSISAAPLPLSAYDPVSANAASPLDGSGSVSVTCTNGAAAGIQLGQGANADAGSTDDAPLRRMSDGGGNFMSYALFSDAARSVIWGNSPASDVEHTGTGMATSISVFARIPAAQNIPAGSYSDTVVATVVF